MSIFSKITILFLMSILIMSILSFKTNEIAQKNMQSNIKDRYIESSKELYDFLIKDDSLELSQRAKDIGYEEVDKKIYKIKKI
jgi:two-component system OmpR family sensor kinase